MVLDARLAGILLIGALAANCALAGALRPTSGSVPAPLRSAPSTFVIVDGDTEMALRASSVEEWLADGAIARVETTKFAPGETHLEGKAFERKTQAVRVDGCETYEPLLSNGYHGHATGWFSVGEIKVSTWKVDDNVPPSRPLDAIASGLCRWWAINRAGGIPARLDGKSVRVDIRARIARYAEAAAPRIEPRSASDEPLIARFMAREPSGSRWTHVYDNGRSMIFFDPSRRCPWGNQYGSYAFVLAPGSPMPALRDGSGPGCIDIARINSQYQRVWVYVPDEEPIVTTVGGGLGYMGYEFAIVPLPVPGSAFQNLTPMMLHAIRDAEKRRLERANRKEQEVSNSTAGPPTSGLPPH